MTTMRAIKVCGYVIAVEKVFSAFTEAQRLALQSGIDDNDIEFVKVLLNDCWPTNLPPFDSIYRPSDEDDPGEVMEAGKMYLLFTEKALFDLVPNETTKRM
jgi:hypothetical protein